MALTTRRSDPPAPPAGAARCARVSLEAGELTAGTASRWRACLLIEEDGPWVPKVLADSRLSAALRAYLDRPDLRVLLIRRHGRRSDRAVSGGVRVIASWSGGEGSWAESITVDSADRLLDVDLDPLLEGRRLGWEPVTEPVVLVCTHGRRDVCCAELGRPVAAALAGQDPEGTWECSHVGGHRFAANVVVLPEGLAYGRVEPGEAVDLMARWRGGQLEPERLRGWVWQEPAVQAAEVVLRQRLGLTGVSDVRVASPAARQGPGASEVRDEESSVEVEIATGAYAGRYVVSVRPEPPTTTDGDDVAVLASCGDEQSTTAGGWRVGALRPR